MPARRALLNPLLRAALMAAALASLAVAAVSGWQLARSPLGVAVQMEATDRLAAAHDRALARAATPEALAARLDARLAETPRNWIAIAALEELAEAQGVLLPEATRAERDRLHALDHGWAQLGASCAACALDPRDCPLSGSLMCGLGVQATVLGDLISLQREAGNLLAGREVDGVDVALSFVGIGATGLALATGGTSLSVKGGAAVLKTAHRMGRLPPEVVQVFARAAREGIDWAAVPLVRSAEDLARLQRPEVLRPAVETAESFGMLMARLGRDRTIALAGHIDTPAEARQLARVSEAIGPRTLGGLELMGKSRFLRVGMRWAGEVWALIAGLMFAFAALVALFWSTLGSIVLRRARRRARG